MGEWLSGIAGRSPITALAWILAAIALLVVVLLIVRLLRGRRPEVYMAGGRQRVPRLNVVDATAIDDHRRLVLVRRDDVEHLILIGGPTDVVVEQAIVPHQGRQAAPPPVQRARTAAKPQPRYEPEMANVPAAEEYARATPEVAAVETAPRSERRQAPAARQGSGHGKATRQARAPDHGGQAQGNVGALEDRPARTRQKSTERERPEVSIEEEMSRLLEDLKNE